MNAVPIAGDDPTLKEWSYAPFYFGSFKLAGKECCFDLFLGGLGKIVEPGGGTLHFKYRR